MSLIDVTLVSFQLVRTLMQFHQIHKRKPQNYAGHVNLIILPKLAKINMKRNVKNTEVSKQTLSGNVANHTKGVNHRPFDFSIKSLV